MEWKDVECKFMVWCGVVWCGVVWCCVVWCVLWRNYAELEMCSFV
jgi:hypothetical protein